MNNRIIYDKRNYNIYFGLLRIYLSFLVVTTHCLKFPKSKYKYRLLIKLIRNSFHVPTFFIMSFYLCNKIFSQKNFVKAKQRFERILIPYFIWPIIIWIIKNFTNLILKKKISFYDLKIQLLTGHCFLTVLWFQYDLIIITLLILIIKLLFDKNSIFILINLGISSYYFQYSNINYNIFSKYSFYLRYPLGRFVESLPFCITGYILASIKIDTYIKNIRIKAIFCITFAFLFFIRSNIFIDIRGFNYQGIKLNIRCILFYTIFLLIPQTNIKNLKIEKIFKILSNNTSGVYYLHLPIYSLLRKNFRLIKKKTFFGSLIIYIICQFISLIGIKFFGNTKLRHLFH